MVAFDVFHPSPGEEALSTIETHPIETDSVLLARCNLAHHAQAVENSKTNHTRDTTSESGTVITETTHASKNQEIARLQQAMVKLRTSNNAKEAELHCVRQELHKARKSIHDTFFEYSTLRGDLASNSQSQSGDTKGTAYRKDIELFVLRKENVQKEKYIKDRDAKLDHMLRRQKATIEAKDEHIQLLADRLTYLEHCTSPVKMELGPSGEHAFEVRLMRVRRGSPSLLDSDEKKDALIADLRERLAVAVKASEAVVNQAAELQRAWDVAKKLQKCLRDERERRSRTKGKLQEMTVKLTAKESDRGHQPFASTRLPTIHEDDHDRKELEAMFVTVQADNIRLHSEMEAIDKRLRDADARMHSAAQDAERLQEQLRFERAINEDMDDTQPNKIIRKKFEKVEARLNENRSTILSQEEEIKRLNGKLSQQQAHIQDLKEELDAAVDFHTQDQDEIGKLTQFVAQLQATKEQLILDHERLASIDHSSQRSSSATMVPEMGSQYTRPSVDISTTEATESAGTVSVIITSTSHDSLHSGAKNHSRSTSSPAQASPMPTKQAVTPASAPLARRSRSAKIKEFVRRVVRTSVDGEIHIYENDKENAPLSRLPNNASKKDKAHMENAPVRKDGNLRPSTAAPVPVTKSVDALPRDVRLFVAMKNTLGHYGPTEGEKREEEKPVSRRGWGTMNKLKRQSLV